jgi:hypothetical protein
MSELPNPLDDFLRNPPRVPSDPAHEEAIYRQTSLLLPLRSGPRLPIAIAVAAAAAFIVFVLGWYILRLSAVERADVLEIVEKAPPVADKLAPVNPVPPVVPVSAHPRDVEWRAFDTEDDRERVRLYFRAGDLFLDRHEDYESALRCYHQALAYCDAQESELAPTDNWLVLALKRDHRKEK